MIYSVFNSNLLLIWGCNLAINKASLILRLPTLYTIAFKLMENFLSLFLHLIKCMFMEWGCMFVEVFFNSDVKGPGCTSYMFYLLVHIFHQLDSSDQKFLDIYKF